MSAFRSQQWYIEEIASDDADDAQDRRSSVVEGEALISSPCADTGTCCNTKEGHCFETLRNSSAALGTNEDEVKPCSQLRVPIMDGQSKIAWRYTYNLRVIYF